MQARLRTFYTNVNIINDSALYLSVLSESKHNSRLELMGRHSSQNNRKIVIKKIKQKDKKEMLSDSLPNITITNSVVRMFVKLNIR